VIWQTLFFNRPADSNSGNQGHAVSVEDVQVHLLEMKMKMKESNGA
jgi:hypothetical protein